jgi:demethylmenaquinone methyltransferase / 2-methoxy-6-polyprenyl-1,4-benzoquinol methylase
LNAGSPESGQGAIAPAGAVREMFDRIVPRYDLINRLMTGGQDVRWRTLAVRAAKTCAPARAIDVATGTADLAIALARGGIGEVAALDFSAGMLSAASPKVAPHPAVALVRGDGMRLPFPDASFDALTISFGLRNMPDYQGAVAEFARVVRPGGRIVILEMTPLPPGLKARLFSAYFTRVVPTIGGWLSGDGGAYRYLPQSVANFPDTGALTRMLVRAGCQRVTVRRLGGGTVALHIGER